jgi:hypothetical protein
VAIRATDLIVVVDASTLVSAALKADSLPERALLRAVNEPNRLLLSQECGQPGRLGGYDKSTLHTFTGSSDGRDPDDSLVRPFWSAAN